MYHMPQLWDDGECYQRFPFPVYSIARLNGFAKEIICMVSESRKRATKKYYKSHPEKIRHIRSKSAAKSFVKRYATLEELDWLEDVIKDQREILHSNQD